MFEWNEISKAAELASGQWEEDVEPVVTSLVIEHVLNHYKLDNIHELLPSQLEEIKIFVDNIHQYKIMKLGFYNLFNQYNLGIKNEFIPKT